MKSHMLATAVAIAVLFSANAWAESDAEIQALKSEIEAMRQAYEGRISELEDKLEKMERGKSDGGKAEEGGSLYDAISSRAGKTLEKDGLVKGLDLDASVVLDTFYYHDDSEEGFSHLKEEISGFGHAHGGGGHDHHHAETENGFNLRHVEVGLSAAVDPYFRAYTTLAFEDGNSEIEEAVIQTTSLPYALTLSGGKFFSGVGRMNRQHSHEWDFFDQPLVYELLFGPHGLQEKGVQLTWLAPTPFYLLLGAEAFNGDNEKMFQSVDADELPSEDGPRLWTGFLKFGPDLGDRHAAQFGLSFAYGDHQEAHDGNGDGADDHWLDGETTLWGLDAVYKYDSGRPHGHGNVVVQAEYFNRLKDLEVERHDLNPAFAGREREDRQDGYYVQALYGFAPRWRAGLRWEQVGLTNDAKLPSGREDDFDPSSRAALMIDWKLSEFSLLRGQAAFGEYETEEGDEDVWEYILQWQVTFGKHAAHYF